MHTRWPMCSSFSNKLLRLKIFAILFSFTCTNFLLPIKTKREREKQWEREKDNKREIERQFEREKDNRREIERQLYIYYIIIYIYIYKERERERVYYKARES